MVNQSVPEEPRNPVERLSFLQASFLSFEDELVLKKLHVPGFFLQELRVALRV